MTRHIPVLLQEIQELLSPKNGEIVIDGTLGVGVHASVMCQLIGPTGILIGIDEDVSALEEARKIINGCDARIYKGNFRKIDSYLRDEGIRRVNKILLDLGISSLQLDSNDRGFSFQRSAPLSMTFGNTQDNSYHLQAEEVVNEWSVETLETIFRGYGEERFAGRIARAIGEKRAQKKITTTDELVRIIMEVTPIWYQRRRIHPATRTFQAIRIAVNDELEALKEFLPKAWDALDTGGRIAIITFHSLEDRIVKNYFRDLKNANKGILINKKPVVPGRSEVQKNPRSRSAKLRVIEKI